MIYSFAKARRFLFLLPSRCSWQTYTHTREISPLFRLVGSNKFYLINICRFFTISMLYCASCKLIFRFTLQQRRASQHFSFHHKLMSIFNLLTFVSRFQHVICKFVKIASCEIDFLSHSPASERVALKNWASQARWCLCFVKNSLAILRLDKCFYYCFITC